MQTSYAKYLLARHGRVAGGVAFCLVALLLAALAGGFDRRVKSADTLAGKWSGNVTWGDASGREYARTMHTALFFLPNGVVGIVLTFPSGAIGGSGTYTLKDGLVTIHCTGLSVDGHALPPSLFSASPWFHDTATYTATVSGDSLTLSGPHEGGATVAPCYPLLLSPKPVILSRVEAPAVSDAPSGTGMKE